MSTTIELYEKLRPQLRESEARSLVEFVERSLERRAATREDLAPMEERLRPEMAELKSDLVKWMFAFWIGTVAVLTGIRFRCCE